MYPVFKCPFKPLWPESELMKQPIADQFTNLGRKLFGIDPWPMESNDDDDDDDNDDNDDDSKNSNDNQKQQDQNQIEIHSTITIDKVQEDNWFCNIV